MFRRVAVIGTGNMGAGLARQLAAHTDVWIGSRDRANAAVLAKAVGAVGSGSYREVAAVAEAAVLAVPWWGIETVAAALDGLPAKVLIDATNPFTDASFRDLAPLPTSGAEWIQARLPDHRVVKAFNHLSAAIPASGDPRFGERPATALICGDDADAKAATMGLVATLGYDARDAGSLAAARSLEALTHMLVGMAFRGLGPNFAIVLLTR